MVKHNSKTARVNMVNAAQAEDSSQVIMGNLSVNDIPAKVLFDTGASHCFMSRPFLPSMNSLGLIWINHWVLFLRGSQ